jgi:formate/nitrite transporter FocA (FNT family)
MGNVIPMVFLAAQDVTTILTNLRNSLGNWGGIILGILGAAALIVAAYQVVKGLISGGRSQINWLTVLALAIVGGLFITMAFGTWASWTNNPSVDQIANQNVDVKQDINKEWVKAE